MRKFTISLSYLAAFLIILIFSNALFAQFEKYSVAANWQYYSLKDKNVSILMPRLPVILDQSSVCDGESTQSYAAYNNGIVFVFRITTRKEVPTNCTTPGKFDEESFRRRAKALKLELGDESDSANNISADSIIKLSGTKGTVKIIKLINDYYSKRWFELHVYGADEQNSTAKNFLDSLKTETNGIEIGAGAEQVFGDDETKSLVQVKTIGKDEKGNEIPGTSPQLLVEIKDTSTRGIAIILKARASYSDSARQSEVRGRVILRVSFLANGAIGDIAVLSGLPNGLTEEAIKAARKIVFIPAQGNGKRISVAKPVEYIFSIY